MALNSPVTVMKTFYSLILLLAAMAGCRGPIHHGDSDGADLFNAVAMRIHPIFTQVKDWTGDGKPDGVEVLIELSDRFSDPTKADGQVMFELFDYRPQNPDPRGSRLVNPWIGQLSTVTDQKSHWNQTTQTYNFQLSYPAVRNDRTYVLTATFETSAGKRFFDRTILTPGLVPTRFTPQNPATQPTSDAHGPNDDDNP